jgi:hypothetical protein
MFKIVLQIPETDPRFETLQDIDWVGEEGPTGPHIKASIGKDAETDEPAIFLRAKAHTWEEVINLIKQTGVEWTETSTLISMDTFTKR